MEKKEQKQTTNKQPEQQPEAVKKRPQEEHSEALVRIFGQDIPASKNVYVGLTKVKGVSWAVANIICYNLKLDKRMKVSDLGKELIGKIEHELKNLKLPVYMMNRRSDLDAGEHKHLLTNDLDIVKEFDIKRMKKMKSYKGMRHAAGQPVRGQRTRSHFRAKRKAVGVKKNDKKA
jgi:small subunit ribosomal protein S13